MSGALTSAAVAVDSVHKRFRTEAGTVRAVNGITLEVAAGTSLAITGESGCGKSTLLSMIGALEPASEGSVSVAGNPVSRMQEEERAAIRREQIGFVFQSHNLQPFLTAVENVSLQLSLACGDRGYERSLELLGTLGLEDQANKYPDQLSGGERQRVAVARALVHSPSLILADEPTGSLDSDNSATVIDLLCEARAEAGSTLVVITHDPAVAARLDRRVGLSDGRVVSDDAASPAISSGRAGSAVFRYARRDLVRNPRRTIASLVGVILGVGLFSGVLFFIDGSGASMTKRALAPVDIDAQRVLTAPLGEGIRLRQRLATDGPLGRGEKTGMILTVENLGAAPANEVVVNDKLGSGLAYVPGSASREGTAIPDAAGQSPFAHGPGLIGHNAGTLTPGERVEFRYEVRARREIAGAADAALAATISTREKLVPDPANKPDLVPLDELRSRIAEVAGVAAANQLAFAELAPGSLRAGDAAIEAPVKIFGFDGDYAAAYPTIKLARGRSSPDRPCSAPRRRARSESGSATWSS